MENKTIVFEGTVCSLHLGRYPITQQNRIQLYAEDGPFLTASKEMEHVELEEDEVIIKDYSENQGILQLLVKEGVIAKAHDKVSSGYSTLYICQLIGED